jgi:hypothetical protein
MDIHTSDLLPLPEAKTHRETMMNIPIASVPACSNPSALAITRQRDVAKTTSAVTPISEPKDDLTDNLVSSKSEKLPTVTPVLISPEDCFRRMAAAMELMFTEIETKKFNQALCSFNPNLANKDFGYTLGPDDTLQVLDPKNNLTPREKEWLTEALNGQEELVTSIRGHVKLIHKLANECRASAPLTARHGVDVKPMIIDFRNTNHTDVINHFDQWMGWDLKSLSNADDRRAMSVDVKA